MIEQTLMRSVKSTGGLTRGTGFGVEQRNVYLFSKPACAEISSKIQDFIGVKFVSSDQHRSAGYSRVQRDNTDIGILLDFFSDHNPFAEASNLKNIATDQVAKGKVNIHRASEVGHEVLKRFENNKVSGFVFKTEWKAVNMANKLNITSECGEVITVDPNLLFQRLTAITTHGKTDMQHVFEFELCPYAAPLAKSVTKMLPADKPKLLENLEQYSSTFFPGLENDVQYVLDGGDLLYKMGDWKKQRTYQDIADQCAKYVIRYYGNCSVVVFDGYPQKPTTKDPAHAERAKDTGIGPDFVVFPHTKLSVKKSIINLIGETLERSGVTIKHAPDDADLLTAKTAIEYSRKQKTVVIGEDTDILVLL